MTDFQKRPIDPPNTEVFKLLAKIVEEIEAVVFTGNSYQVEGCEYGRNKTLKIINRHALKYGSGD